jgi:hypothetical protein
VSLVESELCFFEVEVEGMFGDAIELEQASFGEAPEAFDPIDMVLPASEFVVGVVDPEVLVEAEIDQAIVASPTVGMEDGFRFDSATNDGLECGFGGIRHDLGVDLVASFEQPEDDRLATGSPASLAANATRAEVRLVGFDFALERRIEFARFGHPGPHSKKNLVHRSNRNPGHGRSLGRSQIQHKTAQHVAESCFTDLRMSKVSVNYNHDRSLALSSKRSAS